MNIEKSAKNNMLIALLLVGALVLNIINIWFLPNKIHLVPVLFCIFYAFGAGSILYQMEDV